MSYVAIYRKFRPQAFDQVKGQEAIVRTLQNQIKNNRIGHAYLFTGTRGTGKTTVARIFAKAINCLNPHDGNPCNECENCKAITNGSFLDVIELDAASNNGVDEIRRVIGEVQYTPVSGKYKVYILDEAHMLSSQAANAFLKTLEEPPEYAIFILATTEPQKLPITILSRCQRYDFKRITTKETADNIKDYLSQEGIEAEEKAVQYIARAGDGSMRDALSLLDKVVAFNLNKKLTYANTLDALGTVDTESFSKLYRFVIAGDAFSAISELDDEIKKGKDLGQYINDFVWYIRNLLMVSIGADKDMSFLGVSEGNLKILKEDAGLAPNETLTRYIRILSELINSMRLASAKQVLAEVALIKLACPEMESDNESVLDRIRKLESGAVQKVQVQAVAAAPCAPESKICEPENKACEPENKMSEPESKTGEPILSSETKPVKPVMISPVKSENESTVLKPATETESKGSPSKRVMVCWEKIIQECGPLIRAQLNQTEVKIADDNSIKILGNGVGFNRIENQKDNLRSTIKEQTGCDINIIFEKKPENIEVPVIDEDDEEEDVTISFEPEDYIPAAELHEMFESPEEEPDDIQKLLDTQVGMTVETEE